MGGLQRTSSDAHSSGRGPLDASPWRRRVSNTAFQGNSPTSSAARRACLPTGSWHALAGQGQHTLHDGPLRTPAVRVRLAMRVLRIKKKRFHGQ